MRERDGRKKQGRRAGREKEKIYRPGRIELEEGVEFRRVYDWLPYTYWRILRVMKELGWDMIQIWQGYKANRRPGYCEKYRIVEHETGRVIREEVTIYQIQKAFAHEEVPLEDKQTEKYRRGKLLIAAGEKEEWKQRPVNEKVWNPAAREFYMKYIEEDPTDEEPGTEETEPE